MGTFGQLDAHLFASGTHARLWERLGAHPDAAQLVDADPVVGAHHRGEVEAVRA